MLQLKPKEERSAATMLLLKLKEKRLFLKVLEAILDLVDVANVHCSSTGLKLQAMDTERVAIITLFFHAKDFDDYQCDHEFDMGIPIDAMVAAFRCAAQDDTITIKVHDEVDETIILSFESPKEKNTTVCHFPFVDAENQRFKILDWDDLVSEYQTSVKMSSAGFIRVCNYLSNFGDEGQISVTGKVLKFFARGKDKRVSVKYMKAEASDDVVTGDEPVSVTLDMKYMNSFAKLSALFKQVKIYLSNTHPLVGECKTTETGYIRYFLFPKVNPEVEIKQLGSKRNGNDEGGAGNELRKRIKGADTSDGSGSEE